MHKIKRQRKETRQPRVYERCSALILKPMLCGCFEMNAEFNQTHFANKAGLKIKRKKLIWNDENHINEKDMEPNGS